MNQFVHNEWNQADLLQRALNRPIVQTELKWACVFQRDAVILHNLICKPIESNLVNYNAVLWAAHRFIVKTNRNQVN